MESIDCNICCNKSNNIIKCNNCSKNINDPKDICSNCIIKLKIEDNFLFNKEIIEDDKVKLEEHYDNILIVYTCPYCQLYTDFNITDITDYDNLIKIMIIILKNRIIQSYKNDEFLNKVLGENTTLKNKLSRLENRLNIMNIFNEKYYIICVILIMNFSFLLGITLIINI